MTDRIRERLRHRGARRFECMAWAIKRGGRRVTMILRTGVAERKSGRAIEVMVGGETPSPQPSPPAGEREPEGARGRGSLPSGRGSFQARPVLGADGDQMMRSSVGMLWAGAVLRWWSFCCWRRFASSGSV